MAPGGYGANLPRTTNQGEPNALDDERLQASVRRRDYPPLTRALAQKCVRMARLLGEAKLKVNMYEQLGDSEIRKLNAIKYFGASEITEPDSSEDKDQDQGENE